MNEKRLGMEQPSAMNVSPIRLVAVSSPLFVMRTVQEIITGSLGRTGLGSQDPSISITGWACALSMPTERLVSTASAAAMTARAAGLAAVTRAWRTVAVGRIGYFLYCWRTIGADDPRAPAASLAADDYSFCPDGFASRKVPLARVVMAGG